MTQNQKLDDVASQPNYTESIKAATSTLTLLEANIKKEGDHYVRQLSIARNDLWIASLFIAFNVALFEKAFDVSVKLIHWGAFDLIRLVVFVLTIGIAAGVFVCAFRVFWGNVDVQYGQFLDGVFKNNNEYSPNPRSDAELYCHFVGLMGTLTNSYIGLCQGAVRRGKLLRRIGIAIQVCFALIILNILFYLMELLL
ncbi:MAG: hypothetical protein SOR95_08325 [Sutterella sp.]|nr:hypothetical protein [Sutterella sp.]